MTNTLIKNTIIIAIGKFSTQVISFLLLPLYTTILTDAEYGTYDFINSLVLFLIPFCTLLMEESMFRFLIDSDTDKEKTDIISQSTIFIMINLLIGIILLNVISSFYNIEFKNYIMCYLLASIYNSLAQSIARGMGNIRLYSIGAFISSSFTLILNVIFVAYFKIGIKGLLLSFIISNIIAPTFIIIKLNIWKFISIKYINKNRMKQMIKYSIPLVPNSVSWVIINLSSRLIITPVLGVASNGIYAVANKFPGILNTFYGYFYTAWQEEASRLIKKDSANIYYNIIYKDLKRILAGICLLLIAILPFVFRILINDRFFDAYEYIPLLIFSTFLSNIAGFYGGIFSANKNTKVMGVSTIISSIINLLINVLLISYLGLYAPVLAAIISNLVVCIYRKYKLRKFVIFDKDRLFYFNSIIISLCLIMCYYSNSYTVYSIGFIVSILYNIYINRNIVSNIYMKIRRKVWVS